MTYTPTTWNAGGAPGISATELQKLGAQYDAVLQELKDNTGELWGAIKTADGLGSGLDADKLQGMGPGAFLGVNAKAADSNLLDGHDTSYFATGANLSAHINDKSNPHGVTAGQAGALALGGGTLTGPLTIDGGGQVTAGLRLGVDPNQEPAKLNIQNPANVKPWTTVTARDNHQLTIEVTSDINAGSGNSDEVFRIENNRAYANGAAIYDTAHKPSPGDIGAAQSDKLDSMGRKPIPMNRNVVANGLYTYEVYNDANSPVPYGEVVSFGQGASGQGELLLKWNGDPEAYIRSLRDTTDSWTSWVKLIKNGGDTLSGKYYVTQGLAVGQTDFTTKYASIDGANDIVVNGMFEQDGPGGSAMYNLGLGGAPPANEGELQVYGNSILFGGASSGNYNQIWYDEATNVFHFVADDDYKSTSPGSPPSYINVGGIRLSSDAKGSGAPPSSKGEYGELYFEY